jgi:hypothetical protein
MRTKRERFGVIAAALAALTFAGCDSFFEVERPNVVDGETVDPVLMADEFSWSAHQNLAVAYGGMIVYSAWFTNEARVGDTFPTRNDFGLRSIDDRNGTHRDEVWVPLTRAMASAEKALVILKDIPDADKSVKIARLALVSGYSDEFMAEGFCEGVVDPLGPKATVPQMLDRAIERFKQAEKVASASYAAKLDTTDAKAIMNAARVGLARAYLQKGDKANAAATAKTVPADFVYNMTYINDASNRGRLGNNVFFYITSREALVVGPEWRALADAGDKRIAYKEEKTPAGATRKAQDGELDFYSQQKFKAWDAPIRLASGLEARYIVAEAEENVANMVALINERRTASGQVGTFASVDKDAAMTELVNQRAREFWLEGKRLGDWRRHGDKVPFILASGSTYYKAGQGKIGNQTCMPVSAAEKDNNPNFK